MPFSFRPILKPFFALLLVVTALASYAQYKYQVIFDRSMIENIFETNSAEAGSYLNIYVIAWVLLAGVLPALLLLRTRIIYGHNVLLRQDPAVGHVDLTAGYRAGRLPVLPGLRLRRA